MAAVCMMGVAGEIAWTRMQEGDGNATYRNRIIDAIYNMTGEKLEKGAKYELYLGTIKGTDVAVCCYGQTLAEWADAL